MSQLVPVSVVSHNDDYAEDPMQALAVAQTKALQHLADTKADKREVRRLEAQVAELTGELHFMHYHRDYLTVVALEGYTNASFDEKERNLVGRQLTKLSEDMFIPKQMRKDDRWRKGVGSYHPYVCRQWCVERGWPLPLILEFVKDPR